MDALNPTRPSSQAEIVPTGLLLLILNPGVLKFYLHLRQMESKNPKAYPRGTAIRYLQVADSLSARSLYSRLLGTLDEQILDCFDRSAILTLEQLNDRISSKYCGCSRRWFFMSLRKLVASGELQRQGRLLQ